MLLTDPLGAFYAKGEIKPRYYNPQDMFSEVHFVSPTQADVEPEKVKCLVGSAGLFIHSLGARYYANAWSERSHLARIMAEISPDVVRAYDPGVRGSVAVYWARRLGVPSVVSVHADLDEQRAHGRQIRHYLRIALERYALARATAVICVTRHVERYATRGGAKQPVVIYNKVDTRRFVANSERTLAPRSANGRVSVLTVGRLIDSKHQECLVRAISELDASLTIIGDGDLRSHLERLVADLAMTDRVTFHAAVPHSEIDRHYAAADIFATATHYEGFCIPALEAMSSGLPVVASDIEAMREIVGDAGVLVENTPRAFASALRRLIADPSQRQSLGARARQRALTMDGQIMEEREAEVYRTLLAHL